jgi:hypothetical protein
VYDSEFFFFYHSSCLKKTIKKNVYYLESVECYTFMTSIQTKFLLISYFVGWYCTCEPC